MIPRKKRRMIIIISVVIILLIFLMAFLLLYINTDLFKSNKTLFMKYLGKNTENIEGMYNAISTKTDYENSLEQNKYTVNTRISVNNTENIGTTQENTDNVINQLEIVADGQVDKANQYNYQKINLYKGEDNLLELECGRNSNTYGIKFSDLFQQFLLVDNSNLQDFFSKLGYSEEQIANIPNEITYESLSIEQLKISDDEKEILSNRYIGIIENNINTQNFSKEQNQSIEIDGKAVQVNAYIVTLTKEQLNNLYLTILEQLKNDEIILGKLDKLQNIVNIVNQISQNNTQQENVQDIRDLFIDKIDTTINQINQNNIGNDETKIIIYENMKNTVRTSIQTLEYEINLDFLSTSQEDFIQYEKNNLNESNGQKISLKKTNNNIETIIEKTEGENVSTITLRQNKEINENNNMTKNMIAQYEDSDNRVELSINQQIELVNEFEEQIVLEEENSINIDKLDQGNLQALITTVQEGINTKLTELQNQINMDEITQVLINAKLMKEDNNLYSTGITEAERSRYNSQFEILKGQNLESDRILSVINACESYISDIEIASSTEIKIILDNNNKSEEIVNSLKTFVEENKNEKYNIDVEYDETTGLVRSLILTIVED